MGGHRPRLRSWRPSAPADGETLTGWGGHGRGHVTGLDAGEHRGPPPPVQAPPQPGTCPDQSTLPSTPAQAEGTASPPPGGRSWAEQSAALCSSPTLLLPRGPCVLTRDREEREAKGGRGRRREGGASRGAGGWGAAQARAVLLDLSGSELPVQVGSNSLQASTSLLLPSPWGWRWWWLWCAKPLAASTWSLTPTACTAAGALACGPHAERPLS